LSRALERHLPDGVETSVVVPIMGLAWTDSRFFREKGAIAYGIFPFALSRDELASIHGHDERLPIDELGAGIRRIYGVLVEVASTGGGAHVSTRVDQ
jgi:acetylornithine deacetylase/succinyl-diaminopimelate desuccinylase-like protein